MAEFAVLKKPVAVVIHSLDQSLYQLSALVDGEEHLVMDDNGRPYRSRNLEKVREILQLLPVASITLRQKSAYDEMIGQPSREEDNTLEIALPLSTLQLPTVH
ncbi:MAG: DUF6482 family protein [Halioglobus sp.]